MISFPASQPNNNSRLTMQEFDLLAKDQRVLWHPCSQMKDYELFKPLWVVRAEGSYLELKNGKKIIDAIASWWCKSLGHAHPQLKKALLEQMEQFEHVILANTTNENIVKLSEQLTQYTSSLKKVSYASDGSCVVEQAMKLSLHSRKITGKTHKTQFIALENAYHGETSGALSVTDLGIYRASYKEMLFDAHFIKNIPYVTGKQDPLWHDCSEHWREIEKFLQPLSDRVTAIILEPIVQGAGGMKIYSQDFLKRLRKWTKEHDIHLIADEVMTGIGRTGAMFACEHANIEPDLLCVAKGLTSGWLPLSAVMMTDAIYELFYDDYQSGKSFLHSHTHSGNALAVSIALEVLTIFSKEDICNKAQQLGAAMHSAMQDIAYTTNKISNVRSIGAIVAADLKCTESNRRIGFEVYQKAVTMGALLRPLGNTIYWLPPLNMDLDTLSKLRKITEQAILSVD